MPTPFTELTISNITAGSSAYLAYDVSSGFRLFQTVVDGSVEYLRDITSASPPSATKTLADNATVRGNIISIPGTIVAPASVTVGRRYKILTLGDTPGTYATMGAITTTAGAFEVGRQYVIRTVGDTNYTLVGASANTVGIIFTATGPGIGTGTAYEQYFTPTVTGSGTGTVVSDFSEIGPQVGQPIKINTTWCTITSYISDRAISIDRIVTSGQIVYPSYYPNVVEDTIIGLISVISANATTVEIGKTYQILTTGTTDYTAFGSANNTVGTEFTATNPAILTAGAFVVGKRYTITTVGDTNFVAIGASANTVGIQFTATGVGSGTGTATPTLGTGTVTYYTIERYFTAYNTIPTGSLSTAGTFPGESRIDSVTGDLYIWSGTTWVASGGSASEVIVSATAPGAPTVGMQWFRTTDSRMFLWNGTVWVQTIPGVSGTRLIDTTTVNGLYEGETVIDSTDGNLYIWELGSWELVVESISFDLSNQVHGCPSDFAGTTVDYTNANTQISVFSGGTDLTSLWTITKVESAGITGTLTTPGPHKLYTVTSITADVATVEFTASRVGYADRIATFTVLRVRAGEGGIGAVYQVIPTVNAVKYDQTTYTPATIDFNSFVTTGASTPSAYAGRFKIYYSTNGISYTLDYTSSSDESTKSYTIGVANLKYIKTELFLAGGVTTLLDYESIPIIIDGAPGPQGVQGLQGKVGVQGVQGILGPTGSQGAQGVTGPQGVQGILGPTGAQGAQGVTGPQGIQGILGPAGAQGAQGVTGPQGIQGILGPAGAQGAQGVTGPQGIQGILGPTGSPGAQGVTGPQGIQGVLGPTGSPGAQGVTGPQGVQGILGPTGSPGVQGVSGPQGVQGILGNPGSPGAQGVSGPQGLQGNLGVAGSPGAQGTSGPQGRQGTLGVTGSPGAQGVTGPQGVQGILGTPGTPGAQGVSGPQGVQGVLGVPGPQGVQGVGGPTGQQGIAGPSGAQGLQGINGPTGPGGGVGPAGSPGPGGASLFVYYSEAPITILDTWPNPVDWVSGATYAFNAIVYYDSKIYAMKTVGGITGLTTNPTADTTNWLQVFANGVAIGSTVTGGGFVVNSTYRIKTTSTGFTGIGAANNNAGTYFTATGTGVGITGTAETLIHTNITPTIFVSGEAAFRCVNNSYKWYTNATQVPGGVTAVKWTIYATEVNSSNIGTEDFANPILSIGQTGSPGAAGPTGAVGAQGAQGVQGILGIPGSAGAQGTAGSQGVQGILGTTGAQGAQGVTGPQGRQGTLGVTGAQGAQGVTGPQGVQGILGTAGAQGAQGVTGPQGVQGILGTAGAQGAQGVTGPQGVQGILGTAGAQGAQGVTGPQGVQGILGTTGAQGAQGVTGPQGVQGILGTTGAQGAQGVTGPQGRQGTLGVTGAQGAQGVTGPQGVQGILGPTGSPGTQGTRGPQGVQGILGPTGSPGTPGVAGPQGVQGILGPTGSPGTPGTPGPSGPQGLVGSVGSPGSPGSPGPNGPQGVLGAVGANGAQGLAGSAGNAIGFDVQGTYNNNSGVQSRASYIRLYRNSNLVRQNDVYWNIQNGEVWQWQGPDNNTASQDLTFNRLTRFINAQGLNIGPVQGARVTITDNLISVYDSSDVLRVKMGVW